MKNKMYQKTPKRIFDIVLSFISIIILVLPFFIISILIIFNLGFPIFFTQKRIGYKNKIFKLYKFRTMTNKKDKNGELLPDLYRHTRFGKFLRSTSLDELPEIMNIFFGQMSFVGPRPLLVEYLEFYNAEQIRRHEVKPGLTGWAQINGRNSITWEEKFKLDVWYVENINFLIDMKIIFNTIIKVLKREGIGHSNEDTMPKFKGNNND